MNMNFKRKLPTPKEIKELYPLDEEGRLIKEKNDLEIKNVFLGKSKKFILVIGPCSADNEESVIEYIKKLRIVQSYIDSKPKLVLVKATKNAKSFLNIEEPLIIYNKDGSYTDEIFKIYGKEVS